MGIPLLAAAVLALLPILALSQEPPSPSANGASAGLLAACVNGQPIPWRVLERAVENLAMQRQESLEGLSAEALQKLHEMALSALINTELLYQESQRRKVQIAAGEVELEMEVIKRSPAAFRQMLILPGESEGKLRERVSRKLAIEKLVEQEVVPKIRVEPAKMRELYEAHREEFKRPEEVRLAHILVRVKENATPEEKAHARRRIEELRRRIIGGEDFARVARCCSEDAKSAKWGGDTGFFARGELSRLLEEIAFSLEVGQVSKPVEDATGYHLLKIFAHHPEKYTSFEQAQQFLRTHIERQKRDRLLQEFLDDLKKKARIEIVGEGGVATQRPP